MEGNITTTEDSLSTGFYNSTSISDEATGTNNVLLIMQAFASFNGIFTPVVLFLGLIGNVVTLIVLNTKAYSKIESRFFLMALAASDSVLLLTQVFTKEIAVIVFGRDIRALSDIACKIFFVFFRSSKMTSSWFIVCISIERFIAVWFPFKLKMVCQRKIILMVIGIVYTCLLVYTSLWSYASKVNKNHVCHPDVYDKSNPAEVKTFGVFLILGIALYNGIPIVILLFTTPMIVLKLSRHAQRKKSITNRSSSQQDRTNRMNLTLIGIMIAYIVLVSPIAALHGSAFALKINAYGNNWLAWILFKEIAQILEQMNYTVNFIFYVTLSPIFRNALREILRCGYNSKTQNTSKFSVSAK
ncbi:hypothetical protein FSP39_007034 [Pinctada imbricata]|uniref:G-protein coupled receptors family 1 profile domain-containing protein n=1 Tax=Pinctada imbricata TaxID=66713 RepID=A0AA88YQ82_PINIB|nr:hypothetical protein FSP39_007034 [Pinctada imbricata]